MDALQESSANVESWKKQLGVCKEESDALREKVINTVREVKWRKQKTFILPAANVTEQMHCSLSLYKQHNCTANRHKISKL